MHDDDTPACVIVNVLPPALIVPVRGDALVFAAAVNATLPLPAPLAPEVIVIHPSVVDAVQLHPAGAVTVIVPVPPPETTDCEVGEIV